MVWNSEFILDGKPRSGKPKETEDNELQKKLVNDKCDTIGLRAGKIFECLLVYCFKVYCLCAFSETTITQQVNTCITSALKFYYKLLNPGETEIQAYYLILAVN